MEAVLPRGNVQKQESNLTHEGKLLTEKLRSTDSQVVNATVWDLLTRLSLLGIKSSQEGKVFSGYPDLLDTYAQRLGLSEETHALALKEIMKRQITKTTNPSNN